LVKDKLGVRAVVLRGQEASWRSYGHNDQDRIYLAAKWKVDRKTTLKVDFEHGKVDRYVPRPYFGMDLKSIWEASGRPIFNNFSPNYIPGTPGTGVRGTPGTPILNSGATLVPGALQIGSALIVSERFPYAQNYAQFQKANFPVLSGVPQTDFEMGRRNPEAVLEANWVGSEGEQSFGSIYLQREIVPNLHAELAFNRQTSTSTGRNISWNFNGISADTNKYLPNGVLKPEELLYHVDMQSNIGINSTQTNHGRMALSYEAAVPKLGRLRLAGLGESSESKISRRTLGQYFLKGPGVTSGGALIAAPENAQNRFFYRYYIPDINEIYKPDFTIPGPFPLSNPVRYQNPRTGAFNDIYLHEIAQGAAQLVASNRKNESYLAVAQAYLLKDRLVATFGYRGDRLTNKVGVPVRDPAGEAIQAGTGVWTIGDPDNAKPTIYSGKTYTAGGVFALTRWLSAFYNQSNSTDVPANNFVIPDDPRKIATAELPPSREGTTEDYGIKLNLFEGRVFVTGTKYHTISKNESFANNPRGRLLSIWTALIESTVLDPKGTAEAQGLYETASYATNLLGDSESKGYELEIGGRPLKGLSVALNYAKLETRRSNVARALRNYIDHWKPFWLQYRNLAITQSATEPRPQYAPSVEDWTTREVLLATNNVSTSLDSVNEAVADLERTYYDNGGVNEGMPYVGEFRHSFNFRTRYDFQQGILKGFAVGGGARFRLGRVAGARAAITWAPGTNYTDPLNGRVIERTEKVTAPDQEVYDAFLSYQRPIMDKKFLWRVQLNVNNVTNQRELVINNIDPVTLEPRQYRYQDPRQYILTNTISF